MIMWIGVFVAVALLSIVISIDAVKAKDQAKLYRAEDNTAAWVQALFVWFFSLACFHSNYLLKKAFVKEVHSIKTLNIKMNNLVLVTGVTLSLLGCILLVVAYTSNNLTAQLWFLCI